MDTQTITTLGQPLAGTAATRPSRRDMLAAVGFSGLAAIAVAGFAQSDGKLGHNAPVSADAALLDLIAQFNNIEHQLEANFVNHPADALDDASDQPAHKALHAAQEPLLEQITALRATTLEGFRARAEMFRIWDKEFDKDGDDDGYWPERMQRALVRDLTEGPQS